MNLRYLFTQIRQIISFALGKFYKITSACAVTLTDMGTIEGVKAQILWLFRQMSNIVLSD